MARFSNRALLKEVGRRDLLMGLKLKNLRRSGVRKTVEVFATMVWRNRLADRERVEAIVARLLEIFDRSPGIRDLLSLGTDHIHQVAGVLQAIIITFEEVPPSDRGEAVRRALGTDDPGRDLAATERIAEANSAIAEFYRNIPGYEPFAAIAAAEAAFFKAHAERVRGVLAVADDMAKPPLRSRLQQHRTRVLAALDDALRDAVPHRWALIAALARDFHGFEKGAQAARLLVKNFRDDQRRRFGGRRNRLESST